MNFFRRFVEGACDAPTLLEDDASLFVGSADVDDDDDVAAVVAAAADDGAVGGGDAVAVGDVDCVADSDVVFAEESVHLGGRCRNGFEEDVAASLTVDGS